MGLIKGIAYGVGLGIGFILVLVLCSHIYLFGLEDSIKELGRNIGTMLIEISKWKIKD